MIFAYNKAAFLWLMESIELPIHKLNVNYIVHVISLLFFWHKIEAHEMSIKW